VVTKEKEETNEEANGKLQEQENNPSSDSDSDGDGGGGGLGLLHPSLLAPKAPPKPRMVGLAPRAVTTATSATPSISAPHMEAAATGPVTLSSQTPAVPDQSSYDYYQQGAAYGGDAAQQQYYYQQQQYYAAQGYASQYQQQEAVVEAEVDYGTGSGGKKRDKKLQRELLAGKLDALSKASAQVNIEDLSG